MSLECRHNKEIVLVQCCIESRNCSFLLIGTAIIKCDKETLVKCSRMQLSRFYELPPVE
jgi:hypothetical protein